MKSHIYSAILVASVAVLAACGQSNKSEAPRGPANEFIARIAQHCGQAFEGKVVASSPPVENDPFHGQKLVMHVRECSDDRLEIPFHVGDDHSRTWIITRTPAGLKLEHDHRLRDGSEDPLSMYGGESKEEGTATRWEFPVDQFSMDLFKREGINAAETNTWAMEIEPGERFLYELSRPDGRLFQVEFDLTRPVETPPVPWGYEDK